MTEAVVVHTDLLDSESAGTSLGSQVLEKMGESPDVAILFISPTYQHSPLLQAFKQACRPKTMLGCSSSGEFTSEVMGEGLACAVALRSDEIQFNAILDLGLRKDARETARRVAAGFHDHSCFNSRYRCALILIDTIGTSPEEFLEELTLCSNGEYQFFGGGAGDNFVGANTPVFYDTEVLNDAVVALEILSPKPVGVGLRHGWVPVGNPMTVTEAHGQLLVCIDGRPALEALRQHAHRTEQVLDLENPMGFLLYNFFGVDTGCGYKLRGVMRINPNGSLFCGGEIPSGSVISMMNTTYSSSIGSASGAASYALQKLYGCNPALVFFFDCPATRYRMGEHFSSALKAVRLVADGVPFIGFNTHGQLARVEGQFSGFTNCTPLVCILPA